MAKWHSAASRKAAATPKRAGTLRSRICTSKSKSWQA